MNEFYGDLKSLYDAKLRCVHTDQAPTHKSSQMTELLEKLNVKMSFSSVYTPEQNPYAERSNYSIWSMARTMLLQAKMKKVYWGYAVLYATEILMCLPKKALGWKTPKEVLTGRKPDISRFKVFGCKAWALVPKPHRKKLDPRAKLGVFVGFSQSAPAYLVRVPSTGEIIESPHCLFDESDFGGDSPLNVSTMTDLQESLAPPRSVSLPDVGISVNDLVEETHRRHPKDELRPTHFPTTEVMRSESNRSSIQTQGKRTNRGTKRRRKSQESGTRSELEVPMVPNPRRESEDPTSRSESEVPVVPNPRRESTNPTGRRRTHIY